MLKTTPRQASETPSPAVTPWHLFGTAAVSLSYPFFEVLSQSAPFFIAHDARWPDLLATALLIGYALPALAMAPGLLPRGRWRVRTNTIVFILILIVGLSRMLITGLEFPPALGFASAAGCAVAMVTAYGRSANFRFAFSVFAIAGILFPPGFAAWMRPIVLPGTPEPIRVLQTPEALPPVIFLVLDEMSSLAILNPDRSLDAEHFPNFARLAQDGLWFRNGTAAAPFSENAIAAIASGINPERAPKQPTHRAFPVNVCTALHAAGYRVRARESFTRFCPNEINERVVPISPFRTRVRTLLQDLAHIAPHVYLPKEWADAYFPIGDRWENFAGEDDWDENHRIESMEQFIAELSSEHGVLYFNHFMLPHVPYEYFESGKSYDPAWLNETRFASGAVFHFHQYMQQAMYLDRMLGRMVSRLEELGIYEDCAIVLTADHGVSYRDGADRREVPESGLNPTQNDLLKVPMLFKPPGVGGAQTIDAPVQSTDLTPTLLAALGVEIDAAFDGVAVAADGSTRRENYRFLHTNGTVEEHSIDLLDSAYDVGWKTRAFDPARGFAGRTPYDTSLLDRDVSETSMVEAIAGEVEVLHRAGLRSSAILEGAYHPPLPDESPAWLAIARDDRTVALVQPTGNGTTKYFAVLSPDGDPQFFDPDAHRIDVFRIVATRDGTPALAVLSQSVRIVDGPNMAAGHTP